MQEITIDKDKFKALTDVISILKDLCNDVDIQNSLIQQLSTNRTVLFMIDLKPVFSGIDTISVPICNIRQKLELFKGFFKSVDVKLAIHDEFFTISDSISMLKILKPSREFLDNKFVDSIESLMNLSTFSSIVDTRVPLSICAKIGACNQSFSSSSVQVHFSKEQILFTTHSLNQSEFARIFSIPVQDNLQVGSLLSNELDDNENGVIASVPDFPFLVPYDGEDIRVEILASRETSSNMIFKFEGLVSNVPVSCYCKASFLEE
jgi:hypothetical protein